MPFRAAFVDRPDDINGECFQVDQWRISGYRCQNTMAAFWMTDNYGFHIDSTLQDRCKNSAGFNADCGYVYPNKQYPNIRLYHITIIIAYQYNIWFITFDCK